MVYTLMAIGLCLLAPLPAILVFLYRKPLPAVAVSQASPVSEMPRPGSAPVVDTAFITQEQLPAELSGSERRDRDSVLIQDTRDNSASELSEANADSNVRGNKALPRLVLRSSHIVELVVALPLSIGCSILLATLLHFIAEAYARTIPPAEYLLKPHYGTMFVGPALLIGLMSVVPLTHGLIYLLRGRTLYREYVMWEEGWLSERRTTLKTVFRIYASLAAITTLLFAAQVALTMNWYARFTEDRIIEKPFLAFSERSHSYDQVDQIVFSTDRKEGNEVHYDPQVWLRFNDGTRWQSGILGIPDGRVRFLLFLTSKTGQPIITVRFPEDIPGW